MALHNSHITIIHPLIVPYITTALHCSQVRTYNIIKIKCCIVPVIWSSTKMLSDGRRRDTEKQADREWERERTEPMFSHLIMDHDSRSHRVDWQHPHGWTSLGSCQWMLGVHKQTSVGHWCNGLNCWSSYLHVCVTGVYTTINQQLLQLCNNVMWCTIVSLKIRQSRFCILNLHDKILE